jgi:hypothetical protein
MLRILILLAAITTTAVAAFQWASWFRLFGMPAMEVAAQQWQARIGNTVVAAILWYVWLSI